MMVFIIRNSVQPIVSGLGLGRLHWPVHDAGSSSQLLGEAYSNFLEHFVDKFVKPNVKENISDISRLKILKPKRTEHLGDITRHIRITNGVIRSEVMH